MGFRLTLRRLPEGRIALSVPLWFRLLLLAFALVLLYALGATQGIGRAFTAANIVPLGICALSLLGAGYIERWVFDPRRRLCAHEIGFLGLVRRRAWPLEELAEVEVGQFIRGRPHAPADTRAGLFARPVVTLSLRWAGGETRRLEMYSYSQKPRVRQYALAIAACCGVSLADRSEGPAESPGR